MIKNEFKVTRKLERDVAVEIVNLIYKQMNLDSKPIDKVILGKQTSIKPINQDKEDLISKDSKIIKLEYEINELNKRIEEISSALDTIALGSIDMEMPSKTTINTMKKYSSEMEVLQEMLEEKREILDNLEYDVLIGITSVEIIVLVGDEKIVLNQGKPLRFGIRLEKVEKFNDYQLMDVYLIDKIR